MAGFQVTSQQIAQFQDEGYLIVRQIFAGEEMAGLIAYARGDATLMGESYVRNDGQGGETRLTVRNDLDEQSLYTAIVRSRRIASTMAELLGDEVYHYHHKMTLKQPKTGGAWEWHQDYGYWYHNGCLYPDMASCMIAVDKATQANGCLQVLKGSHKIGRVDHGKVGEQTRADPARVEAAVARHELVYCEMDPGDAVFFHSNLLHRSDQNTSELPRWSLICCYNTRHNDPYITGGRHPNYSPLEIWPDERVMEMIQQQAAID